MKTETETETETETARISELLGNGFISGYFNEMMEDALAYQAAGETWINALELASVYWCSDEKTGEPI